MKPKLIKKLIREFKPKPDLNVWQFCEKNVDFGREPAYDCESKTKYRADYLPFYKEIQEASTDLRVREIYLLKCARAGASENTLLNALRYAVGYQPRQTLWVTGGQLGAQRMMKERIIPAIRMTTGADQQLKEAAVTEHDIAFPAMKFTLGWAGNKAIAKQAGYSLILLDELSTYSDFSLPMIRKRADTYTFSHIIGISSPDPAAKRAVDEDPIFMAFEEGDKRYWFLEKDKEVFRFEMGDKHTVHGLKWDQSAKKEDGDWDLNKVAESAHYVTPNGQKIYEKDRWNLVKNGRWVPTKESLNGVRSYHISAFYLPFKSGTFGSIAVEFLKAKRAGSDHLKQFHFEVLAEKFHSTYLQPNISLFSNLQSTYKRGELPSKTLPELKDQSGFSRILTVDVQKDSFWTLSVELDTNKKDIYIVDYKQIFSWSDLSTLKNSYKPNITAVDASYRTSDVKEMALALKFTPIFARENNTKPVRIVEENAYEGTVNQKLGKMVNVLHIKGSTFKDVAADLLNQNLRTPNLFLPANCDATLFRHLGCEKKVDGKWVAPHKDNHLWDCLVYCLAILHYYKQLNVQVETEHESEILPATA